MVSSVCEDVIAVEITICSCVHSLVYSREFHKSTKLNIFFSIIANPYCVPKGLYKPLL
jgi:hypothetical protein